MAIQAWRLHTRMAHGRPASHSKPQNTSLTKSISLNLEKKESEKENVTTAALALRQALAHATAVCAPTPCVESTPSASFGASTASFERTL